MTVVVRLELRRHGPAEAKAGSDPGRTGRPPRQPNHAEVGAEGRQTEEQQRAVMRRDGPTLVRPEHGSSGEDVSLNVVDDRAGGKPAVGQRGDAARLDQSGDIAPAEARAAQVGNAGQTVPVGGVHPVFHGSQPGEPLNHEAAARVPAVENANVTRLGSQPSDSARHMWGVEPLG